MAVQLNTGIGSVYFGSTPNTDSESFDLGKTSFKDVLGNVDNASVALNISTSKFDQTVLMSQDMISGQAKAYGIASGNGTIWDYVTGTRFMVSSSARAQAKEDISENGYWGVKHTSERLFDFAQALAQNDSKKLMSMKEAVENGYNEAQRLWSGKLPSICKDTLNAANLLFENSFAYTGDA